MNAGHDQGAEKSVLLKMLFMKPSGAVYRPIYRRNMASDRASHALESGRAKGRSTA